MVRTVGGPGGGVTRCCSTCSGGGKGEWYTRDLLKPLQGMTPAYQKIMSAQNYHRNVETHNSYSQGGCVREGRMRRHILEAEEGGLPDTPLQALWGEAGESEPSCPTEKENAPTNGVPQRKMRKMNSAGGLSLQHRPPVQEVRVRARLRELAPTTGRCQAGQVGCQSLIKVQTPPMRGDLWTRIPEAVRVRGTLAHVHPGHQRNPGGKVDPTRAPSSLGTLIITRPDLEG